ncbi:hypothetical protein FQZ97_983230 [compost metagenome]
MFTTWMLLPRVSSFSWATGFSGRPLPLPVGLLEWGRGMGSGTGGTMVLPAAAWAGSAVGLLATCVSGALVPPGGPANESITTIMTSMSVMTSR